MTLIELLESYVDDKYLGILFRILKEVDITEKEYKFNNFLPISDIKLLEFKQSISPKLKITCNNSDLLNYELELFKKYIKTTQNGEIDISYLLNNKFSKDNKYCKEYLEIKWSKMSQNECIDKFYKFEDNKELEYMLILRKSLYFTQYNFPFYWHKRCKGGCTSKCDEIPEPKRYTSFDKFKYFKENMVKGKEGCFTSNHHNPCDVNITGLKCPGKMQYWEYNIAYTGSHLDMYKNDKLPLLIDTKNPTQEHDYYTLNTMIDGYFGCEPKDKYLNNKLFKKHFPDGYCPYIAYAD